MYTQKIAENILDKIRSKGWNAYYRAEDRKTPEETISSDLANCLEEDKSYVLLPNAADPQNPAIVFNALKQFSKRNDGRMPTITFDGLPSDFTGFTLKKDFVKLHIPEGIGIGYEHFLYALDTIIDANDPENTRRMPDL